MWHPEQKQHIMVLLLTCQQKNTATEKLLEDHATGDNSNFNNSQVAWNLQGKWRKILIYDNFASIFKVVFYIYILVYIIFWGDEGDVSGENKEVDGLN